MEELMKKLKNVKEQIEWAKREIEKPEYKDDPESQSFFKGILFLEKYLED